VRSISARTDAEEAIHYAITIGTFGRQNNADLVLMPLIKGMSAVSHMGRRIALTYKIVIVYMWL